MSKKRDLIKAIVSSEANGHDSAHFSALFKADVSGTHTNSGYQVKFTLMGS